MQADDEPTPVLSREPAARPVEDVATGVQPWSWDTAVVARSASLGFHLVTHEPMLLCAIVGRGGAGGRCDPTTTGSSCGDREAQRPEVVQRPSGYHCCGQSLGVTLFAHPGDVPGG